tara:strand:- start:409 stop:609 length:201 start_codon:yes stop_codon:yes gene_type:complete
MNWIKVEDKLPKQVTPVLVYGECCDICCNIAVAELENDNWFISGLGEDLIFTPTHWCKIEIPENEN